MQESDTRIYGTPLVTDVSMDGTLHSNDPYTSQNVSYLSVRKDGGSIEKVSNNSNKRNDKYIYKLYVVFVLVMLLYF